MYTGNSINESEKKTKYVGLSEGRYYIGTKDVEFNHTVAYENGVKIPFDAERFRTAPCSSILMCIEGGSAGRKIAFTDYEVCFGNKLCCFVSYGIDYKFLYYYLQSPIFQSAFKENTTGIIGGVSVNTLKSMLLPVPPIGEQKRIVKMLIQLAPLLEKYEQAETELTKLNNDFPELLKKSILQEAVQGRLVPQDPNDEPASVLLERIRAEKQALIKAGKIKKDKHESIIVTSDKIPYEIVDGKERCIADEVSFEIPDSWCWCKLNDIVGFIGGYAYNSSDFIQKSNNQVLRLGNVKNDKLKLSAKPVYISDDLANETAAFKCKINDILITMTGTRKKRDYFFTVRVLTDNPPLFINQRVGCLRTFENVMSHWLTWILKSETILSQVFKYETGTANQGNLGAENIMKTMIPLPPLAEQKRIVNRIEELMKYCKKL